MSIAAATASAAQSSAVQNNGTSSASGSASTTSGQNALTSLSGNFQDFLGMLMTQLKNQDPSSPMDTNSFTQELVEFSSVEQQINTNTSLTQLISLTQSGEMMQASGMVGKKVELSSTQMPLQNSSGSLSFTAAAAGTAEITISSSAGTRLMDTTIQTTEGSNSWTWNGKDSQGNTLPDGGYTVAVTGGGTTGALPFTVSGKVTGVINNSGTLNLQLGTETVPFSSVESVSN